MNASQLCTVPTPSAECKVILLEVSGSGNLWRSICVLVRMALLADRLSCGEDGLPDRASMWLCS